MNAPLLTQRSVWTLQHLLVTNKPWINQPVLKIFELFELREIANIDPAV